jgi:rhomboid protease GluP
MNWTDPRPSYFGRPEVPHQTSCTYLAKQFIAKNGFEIASIPEVQELVALSDIVLTHSDGYTFTILCMIDREAHPDKIFNLGVDEIREIGEACLKYTGEMHRTKMPVSIGLLEVGPDSTEQQQQRLTPFKKSAWKAKVVPFAMTVDTASGQVWSNNTFWFVKGGYGGFIEKVLASPREADADLTPPVIAVAQPSFPILTAAILAVLLGVFAAEVAYGVGPPTKPLQPAIATLLAFGGLIRPGVVQYGEWYRLLAAPFLHLDAGHLAMNAIGLFLAGRRLESLIGRAWFGAVYVVGALGGSLLSLALNAASIVSVGASGAIMGLFAAMLVASGHFPPGAIRTRLQMDAVYVLIPSLLPLTSALQGHQVDYAAHFGGAIAGAAVGFVMISIWSRTEPWPGFRNVAAAIGIAGLVVLAYPIISVLRHYDGIVFAADLIPKEYYPSSDAIGMSQSSYYSTRYPRDPRSHMFRALALLAAQDRAGAESEARQGLREEDLWGSILPNDVSLGLRTTLAIVIAGDRLEEAKAVVRPVCNSTAGGRMRKVLDDSKLCSS